MISIAANHHLLHRAILPSLLACLSMDCTTRADDDASMRERFLREYPAAVQRLEQRFEADGTLSVIDKSIAEMDAGTIKTKEMDETRYVIYTRKPNVRLDEYTISHAHESSPDSAAPGATEQPGAAKTPERDASTDGKTVVRLFTDGRSYLAGRKNDGTPFSLGGYRDGMSPVQEFRVRELTWAPFSIKNVRLLDLCLNPPNAAVRKIEKASSGGRSLVKVEFQHRGDRARRIPECSGWFLVDPQQDWILDSYHFEQPPRLIQDGTISYKRDSTGVLRCSRVETTARSTDSKSTMTWNHTLDYGDSDPASPSESVFTLASLGLPELGDVSSARSTSSVPAWLIGTAVVALCAGLLMRYYANRSGRESEPSL